MGGKVLCYEKEAYRFFHPHLVCNYHSTPSVNPYRSFFLCQKSVGVSQAGFTLINQIASIS